TFSKVGFNNVKRIASAASLLDTRGVIITITSYSKSLISKAGELDIILADPRDLIDQLNSYVEEELNNRDIDAFYHTIYS
ncbi:14233_t:CDS:1, partial [Dentiscutata heterogama]